MASHKLPPNEAGILVSERKVIAVIIENRIAVLHLKAREYFTEIEHPELGTLKYPGAPYKFHATYVGAKRPAPLVGQYNQEVYGELGISEKELADLGKAGVI